MAAEKLANESSRLRRSFVHEDVHLKQVHHCGKIKANLSVWHWGSKQLTRSWAGAFCSHLIMAAKSVAGAMLMGNEKKD